LQNISTVVGLNKFSTTLSTYQQQLNNKKTDVTQHRFLNIAKCLLQNGWLLLVQLYRFSKILQLKRYITIMHFTAFCMQILIYYPRQQCSRQCGMWILRSLCHDV